jgi:hypothetical protein
MRTSSFSRIVFPNVPRLLGDKRPDFIALDSTARQLAPLGVHQYGRSFASQDKQSHYGVNVEVRALG